MSYSEHEKLKKVQEKSQAIGEFLDWLFNSQKFQLARWGQRGDGDRLIPDYITITDLLARYYHIDQKKLEQEKRQILADFVKKQEEQEKT